MTVCVEDMRQALEEGREGIIFRAITSIDSHLEARLDALRRETKQNILQGCSKYLPALGRTYLIAYVDNFIVEEVVNHYTQRGYSVLVEDVPNGEVILGYERRNISRVIIEW